METINRKELAEAIHKNAVEKGFWDEQHSPEHYLMLVITELSEAVEAYRKDDMEDYHRYVTGYKESLFDGWSATAFEMWIKDSVGDEQADAYIRLLDLAEGFGWEVESEYNIKDVCERSISSKTFIEAIYHTIDFTIALPNETKIPTALCLIEAIAEAYGIPLAWHIEEKMKYNATRPRLHGKKC